MEEREKMLMKINLSKVIQEIEKMPDSFERANSFEKIEHLKSQSLT